MVNISCATAFNNNLVSAESISRLMLILLLYSAAGSSHSKANSARAVAPPFSELTLKNGLSNTLSGDHIPAGWIITAASRSKKSSQTVSPNPTHSDTIPVSSLSKRSVRNAVLLHGNVSAVSKPALNIALLLPDNYTHFRLFARAYVRPAIMMAIESQFIFQKYNVNVV